MATTMPHKFNIVIASKNMPSPTHVNKITRYDYNLTIMKSPKPATDNRFKK
jgi:hypothetical protein